MVKIFIDPGHGGTDSGAVANDLMEKDITLIIAMKIKEKLSDYANLSVRLSRMKDRTVSLNQRTNAANRWGADYFVSIHVNAGGGTGYEDYIHTNSTNSSQSSERQETMHNEINRYMDWTNRGKKNANFHVLRESKMPAILTENGFIDSEEDAQQLKDSSFLDKVAQGHVNGIVRIFNLKKKVRGNISRAVSVKPKEEQLSNRLIVDGRWGSETTRALQRALGTVEDGIISNQVRNSVTTMIVNGITFGNGGSMVIRSLQDKVGASADGLLGPETIRRLQMYLGTPVDGVISNPSMMVKELQRRLNADTF
ncbi:N-acetylmuramoyl-L-alanine amidase family protein [Gracilibacillus pellucidus]|uniref:N-acetylmuramoyl-L-alanine amidase family protein n=1 Tax=Gracilibacillus pellucidus TaxID=3095368 RepID=UPI0039B6FFEB